MKLFSYNRLEICPIVIYVLFLFYISFNYLKEYVILSILSCRLLLKHVIVNDVQVL